MLRHIGLVFTAVLNFGVVSQSKAASKQEILRVNWNEQSIAELEKLIPDQKAAQQFATQILKAEPHTDPEHIHKLDVDMEVLGEYEFVDLKGDGSVQFVVSVGRYRPHPSNPADGS